VFKGPNGANEPLPDAVSMGSSNTRKSQYFGNGYASLFQDEVTLCGEGRLDAGIYEFNFELEFPDKGLPTSIDVRAPQFLIFHRESLTHLNIVRKGYNILHAHIDHYETNIDSYDVQL